MGLTETKQFINDIYKTINARLSKLIDKLNENAGYDIQVDYFPHHYYKSTDGLVLEEYPIPILTIDGIIEVGIDITHMYVELYLTKEKAKNIDFRSIERPFDLYAEDELFEDVYNPTMNKNDILDNLELSQYEDFRLQFAFEDETQSEDDKIEMVVNLVEVLSFL